MVHYCICTCDTQLRHLYLWLYYRPVDRELARKFLVDLSRKQVGRPWPEISVRHLVYKKFFLSRPWKSTTPCGFPLISRMLIKRTFLCAAVVSDRTLCLQRTTSDWYENLKLSCSLLVLSIQIAICWPNRKKRLTLNLTFSGCFVASSVGTTPVITTELPESKSCKA